MESKKQYEEVKKQVAIKTKISPENQDRLRHIIVKNLLTDKNEKDEKVLVDRDELVKRIRENKEMNENEKIFCAVFGNAVLEGEYHTGLNKNLSKKVNKLERQIKLDKDLDIISLENTIAGQKENQIQKEMNRCFSILSKKEQIEIESLALKNLAEKNPDFDCFRDKSIVDRSIIFERNKILEKRLNELDREYDKFSKNEQAEIESLALLDHIPEIRAKRNIILERRLKRKKEH